MFSRLLVFVAALLLNSSLLFAAEVHLLSGDTVMIGGQRFRLHGISAPALDEICTASNGSTWPCGRKALDQLTKAAALDEMVCQVVERKAVLCRVAGLDVGALLVKEGLAKAAGDYGGVEDRARATKAGIWQ